MPVVDVHTHLVTEAWLDAMRDHGGPRYQVRETRPGSRGIFLGDSIYVPLMPDMFDPDSRVASMDEGEVDISIASMLPPSVDWGGSSVAASVATVSNDALAAAQERHPDRLRWVAALPWEHETEALRELDRACGNGAVGVSVPANVNGRFLTDPAFAAVWQTIDARALPVLLHPAAPPGSDGVELDYHLLALVAFMYDTTLSLSQMIYDGFFDRYTALKLVVPHAGAVLPALIGRLDRGHEHFPACSRNITQKPSSYLSRIWFDDIAPGPGSLTLFLDQCGSERLLHGSDYPFSTFARAVGRLDGLDRSLRQAILSDNAGRLFAF